MHNFSSTTDQNEPKFIGGIFICEIKTVGYIIIINRLLIYKFHIISNIGKSLKFNVFMIRAFWGPKMKLVVPKRLRIDRRLSSYKQIIFSSEPLNYPNYPMNKGVRAIRSELTFNYPFFVYSIISN